MVVGAKSITRFCFSAKNSYIKGHIPKFFFQNPILEYVRYVNIKYILSYFINILSHNVQFAFLFFAD